MSIEATGQAIAPLARDYAQAVGDAPTPQALQEFVIGRRLTAAIDLIVVLETDAAIMTGTGQRISLKRYEQLFAAAGVQRGELECHAARLVILSRAMQGLSLEAAAVRVTREEPVYAGAIEHAAQQLKDSMSAQNVADGVEPVVHVGHEPHPQTHLTGSFQDRYPFRSHLGTGGQGQVILATDRVLGIDLAVKIVRGLGGVGRVDQLAREAMVTAKLDHPNVARVFDAGHGTDEGGLFAYVSMRYVEPGTPIDRYVRAERLSHKQVVEKMIPVCKALEHAHGRGIVHGDLKPANVLMNAEGQPVVIDFGIAEVTERLRKGEVDLTARPNMASAGAESPEHGGTALQVCSDIYALGSMFLQLLHISSHRTQVPHAAAAEAAVQPGTENYTGVPHELAEVLKRMLRQVPEEDQYTQVLEVRRDLEAWAKGRPLKIIDYSPIGRAGLCYRRNPRRFVTIAALTATTLVFVVWTGLLWWAHHRAAQALVCQQTDFEQITRAFDRFMSLANNRSEFSLSAGVRWASPQEVGGPRGIAYVMGRTMPDTPCTLWALTNANQRELVAASATGAERGIVTLGRSGAALRIPPEVSTSYTIEETPRTQGYLVEDFLPAHDGVEVAVIERHQTMFPAVLRIYDCTLSQVLVEVWSIGHWYDLYYNQDSKLLLVTGASNRLAATQPEFLGWDALWASSKPVSVEPSVIVAMRPADLPPRSIVYPGIPSAELPATPVAFVLGQPPYTLGPEDDRLVMYTAGFDHPHTPGAVADIVITFDYAGGSRSHQCLVRRSIDCTGQFIGGVGTNAKGSDLVARLLPNQYIPINVIERTAGAIELREALAAAGTPSRALASPSKLTAPLTPLGKQMTECASRSPRWLLRHAMALTESSAGDALRVENAGEMVTLAEKSLIPGARHATLVQARVARALVALRKGEPASLREAVLITGDLLDQDSAARPMSGFRSQLLAIGGLAATALGNREQARTYLDRCNEVLRKDAGERLDARSLRLRDELAKALQP